MLFSDSDCDSGYESTSSSEVLNYSDSEQEDVEAVGPWDEIETDPADWEPLVGQPRDLDHSPHSEEDLQSFYWQNSQEHADTQTDSPPTYCDSGVQTDLYAANTTEDLDKLTADLPNDFWDDEFATAPSSPKQT